MRIILNVIYLLIAMGISPMVIFRMLKHGRYRHGWRQRFGKIIRKDAALKKCIWIHAVSVGEVNATRTVIEQLQQQLPDYDIVLSVTTDTGFNRAKTLYGDQLEIFFYPLDFSVFTDRAFTNIQPNLCVLMELEIWPNFILSARRNMVPVIVANGRISDNSFNKYRKIKFLVRKMMAKLSLVLAQTPQYAQRFHELGVRPGRVVVTGSLKYDTAQITDSVEGADKIANQCRLNDNRPLWVAGGTGPEEETIILNVYRKLIKDQNLESLKLAVVPRKPERFDEVARQIEQAGLTFIRYSEIKDAHTPIHDEYQVILVDTIGDLRKFYSLATVIFVGRSLVPMGGSDMIEAAALGKCTLFGPHTFNFKQTVDALLAGDGALLVQNETELFETMAKCMSEPAFRKQIAHNGQNVIQNNQGATGKTVEEIKKALKNPFI